MERDCDSVWIAGIGEDIRKNYDAILRLYASYDETGVWHEFGGSQPVAVYVSRQDGSA